MKLSLRKGFSFGLTSGIITTLGLIIGLYSGTHLKSVIISGILVIAVADSLSDAFGMHISEEADTQHTAREVWESTLATFVAKFIFALSFIIPILFLALNLAVVISIIWGLLLISCVSYAIALQNGHQSYKIILEHLSLAIFVVVATYFIGNYISELFK